MQRLHALLAGLVFIAGCDAFGDTLGQAAKGLKPAPAAKENSSHGPAFERLTTEMRSAIIAGSKATAKAKATQLKQQLDAAVDPDTSALAGLRLAAHQGSEARSLSELTTSLAAMGQACGACHQQHAVTPVLASPTPPDQPPAMQMQLHQWATDRLWEGLVQPSDRRWQQGCDALRDDPLAGEPNDRVPIEHVTQLKRVHALAQSAGRAHDRTQQAKAYADLLTTCGKCHGS